MTSATEKKGEEFRELIEGFEYIFRLANARHYPCGNGACLNAKGECVYKTTLPFDDVLRGTIVRHWQVPLVSQSKDVLKYPVTHGVVIKVTVPFARTTVRNKFAEFDPDDMPRKHDVIEVYFTDQGMEHIKRAP